jgi:hypothetical protein
MSPYVHIDKDSDILKVARAATGGVWVVAEDSTVGTEVYVKVPVDAIPGLVKALFEHAGLPVPEFVTRVGVEAPDGCDWVRVETARAFSGHSEDGDSG